MGIGGQIGNYSGHSVVLFFDGQHAVEQVFSPSVGAKESLGLRGSEDGCIEVLAKAINRTVEELPPEEIKEFGGGIGVQDVLGGQFLIARLDDGGIPEGIKLTGLLHAFDISDAVNLFHLHLRLGTKVAVEAHYTVVLRAEGARQPPNQVLLIPIVQAALSSSTKPGSND